ncbi:hypothetical protein BASA83_006285 [Batrachochytrium salamandrivorans]|nr:hypothetical protein BASA83_006285 [Batrachochytrium salamandrivorans]
MDTSYDEQLKYQEYSTLKIGDVPLTSGYHADLLSTLRHEAPALCVRFTCNSELVAPSVSQSLDAWILLADYGQAVGCDEMLVTVEITHIEMTAGIDLDPTYHRASKATASQKCVNWRAASAHCTWAGPSQAIGVPY